MELRHLKYFIEITHDLNMTKAAERLHMSQPPLSRQIRQLEESLGTLLFDRSGKHLELTPAGRFFINRAKNILNSVEEVEAAMKRMGRSGNSHWLNIGFVPSTLYGFLPDLIRSYSHTKNVEIGLSEYMTARQIIALKAGDIDVGFGRIIIDDAKIKREIVLEEQLMAVLPKGHHLARRSSLSLKTLSLEKMILYPVSPRPSYADQVLEIFAKKNIRPKVVHEVQELQTALGLVASGIGVSLVPYSVQKMRPDVVYIPLEDKSITSPVVMMYRIDDQSEVLQQFIKRVRLLSSISKQNMKKK